MLSRKAINFTWVMIFLVLISTVFITASAQGATDKKSELVLAISQEPEETFDPTKGWGSYGSPLFQSTLLRRDADLKLINDLATGFEVSPDGLSWKVTIRQDAKFSDGQPLTGEDVKFTFETAAAGASRFDLESLKNIELVDDYTVVFHLKRPLSTFSDLLVNLGIVPKHAYGQDYGLNPIGSGPYKMVQWDKGQQVIVEANPYYYGTKPYFTKLTFLFLSEDTAYAAAKAGKIDVVAIPPSLSKQTVEGMKLIAADSVDCRGILFPFLKSGGKNANGYPIGNDVTSDIAIRRAINVAIDRQALVEGVLEGQGTKAFSDCDGLPWGNPEMVFQDGDLEKAKKILDEAGWKDTDGDGVRDKGGLKAELTLLYDAEDRTRQSLAIAVADMLKPIGVKINADGKSWDDIEKMMFSTIVVFGWGKHSPIELIHLYSSKEAGVGWSNTGYYSNPVVDGYLEKALTAVTEDEANGYWKKAQWDGQTGPAFQGDALWAWMVNLKHCYLFKDGLDIGRIKIQPHGHGWPITENITEWTWK